MSIASVLKFGCYGLWLAQGMQHFWHAFLLEGKTKFITEHFVTRVGWHAIQ